MKTLTADTPVVSTDGKKKLIFTRNGRQNCSDFWRVDLTITDVAPVTDVVSKERWRFNNAVRVHHENTYEETLGAYMSGIMVELRIQFFKLILRRPELLQAYVQQDWELIKQGSPRFGYMMDFVGVFSREYLGTEWVVPPADKMRTAEIRSRASFDGVELWVDQRLTFLKRMGSDTVRIESRINIALGTVNARKAIGVLTLEHHYSVEEWPSVSTYLAERRIRRILHAWLDELPTNYEGTGPSVTLSELNFGTHPMDPTVAEAVAKLSIPEKKRVAEFVMQMQKEKN